MAKRAALPVIAFRLAAKEQVRKREEARKKAAKKAARKKAASDS